MAVEFEASIDGMTPQAFGSASNGSVLDPILDEQFPNPLTDKHTANWEDVAVIADAGGDYLRTRTSGNDNNQKSFNAPLTTRDTYYVRYSVMFESTGTSGLVADNGFDFGDSDGLARVAETGGKMPGLLKGAAGSNSGGTYTNTGFSGRLMWRGIRKSDGIGGLARETVTLSLYGYFYQYGTGPTSAGAETSFYFNSSFADPVVQVAGDGLTAGRYGDPNTYEVPTDTWIHLLLGYHCPDSAAGFFKAWTWEDGTDTEWQERVHVPDIRWMAPGNSGIDGFLFNQLWGGASTDWFPDRTAYMRFKNFGAYTTQTEAAEAFGLGVPPPGFSVSSPADLATDVTTPVTPSGTAPDDGSQGYETSAVVDGNSPVWNPATFTAGTETWVTDSGITIPQNGETIRIRQRRWS